MKEGDTFFFFFGKAAGCEVGEKTLARQPNPGSRNLLQQKLSDPSLAHPSD